MGRWMGRKGQTEGVLPRRNTPPSVAKATATSPFALRENGEDLTAPHPAANPDDNANGKASNDGLTGAGGLNRTGLAGAHWVRMADEQRAGVS